VSDRLPVLHLDLFSGIGGFAYAADQVFGDVTHVFCDNEPFSQAVLRKHWPESYIFNDIRYIKTIGQIHKAIADTHNTRSPHRQGVRAPRQSKPTGGIDILTGGFPCQPFSAAGLRRGTADDRHLWPEMLRVIRLTAPTWVIAENVGGILTWNAGMVFEQVCADLEAAGYDVQPFVIPAVAVNAPHRRDRVWFVGHAKHDGQRWNRNTPKAILKEQTVTRPGRTNFANLKEQIAYGKLLPTPDAYEGSRGGRCQALRPQGEKPEQPDSQQPNVRGTGWNADWTEVATELCSLDDGLPAELDGLKLSKPQHRKEQLKAYGNAIVPQVAMQIMSGFTG
jgi:DNA (cytosine-5)-methyltransferase 1